MIGLRQCWRYVQLAFTSPAIPPTPHPDTPLPWSVVVENQRRKCTTFENLGTFLHHNLPIDAQFGRITMGWARDLKRGDGPFEPGWSFEARILTHAPDVLVQGLEDYKLFSVHVWPEDGSPHRFRVTGLMYERDWVQLGIVYRMMNDVDLGERPKVRDDDDLYY